MDLDRADFSGITTQEHLNIYEVVHQASISVDEKGTEASAATAVAMAAASGLPTASVTLHVDRPFIFAVRDASTGAILFRGRVVDPSAPAISRDHWCASCGAAIDDTGGVRQSRAFAFSGQ